MMEQLFAKIQHSVLYQAHLIFEIFNTNVIWGLVAYQDSIAISVFAIFWLTLTNTDSDKYRIWDEGVPLHTLKSSFYILWQNFAECAPFCVSCGNFYIRFKSAKMHANTAGSNGGTTKSNWVWLL